MQGFVQAGPRAGEMARSLFNQIASASSASVEVIKQSPYVARVLVDEGLVVVREKSVWTVQLFQAGNEGVKAAIRFVSGD